MWDLDQYFREPEHLRLLCRHLWGLFSSLIQGRSEDSGFGGLKHRATFLACIMFITGYLWYNGPIQL